MRRLFFGIALLICLIACKVSPITNEIADGGLTSKAAVLRYATYKFADKEYPVVAYVTESTSTDPKKSREGRDGQVCLTWIEPQGENAVNYEGLEITFSKPTVDTTNPVQMITTEPGRRGEQPFRVDPANANGNWGSNGAMFVNKNTPESDPNKYYFRDLAWKDAALCAAEKGYDKNYKGSKPNPSKIEQSINICLASEFEHVVINVRAYEKKSAHGGQEYYYPRTTLVQVVEFAASYEAFGYGYDVPDGPYFAPSGVKKSRILDLNKLKNKQKYAIGEIQVNESTSLVMTGETKKDFLNKVNEGYGQDMEMKLNTEFYKQKFNFNFKDQFSHTDGEVTSGVKKQYYGKFQNKIIRRHQYLLEQYCYPEYLDDCLDDMFKTDINDPTKKPKDIFDTYGTHVLLDVVLGGRCDLDVSGVYNTSTTTKSTEEICNELFVVVDTAESHSSNTTTTITTNDCWGCAKFQGGPSDTCSVEWDRGTNSFKGDLLKWSQGIDDSNCQIIDSPTCIRDEDKVTGVWNFAKDPRRRQQLKEAYLEKCYGNYASLISGVQRTASDGLYIKSFGFVTFYNPNYPEIPIDGEPSTHKEGGYWAVKNGSNYNYVWKDKFYLTLQNPGKTNEGFDDFPEDMIRTAAVQMEERKGNYVEPDQVHFFAAPGYVAGQDNKLFKIVDARRDIYSDPLYSTALDHHVDGADSVKIDKSRRGTEDNYSVRLGGSLRYNHVGTGKYKYDTSYDAINTEFAGKASKYDRSMGYIFYYPYYVTTTNPDEALTGIISGEVTLNSNDDASSSVYATPSYKNSSLFGSYSGLSEVCHDYGSSALETYDQSKAQSFADSWVLASDHVFNVYRPGSGKDVTTGKGDLLENPVNLGLFKEYANTTSTTFDFPLNGEDYESLGETISQAKIYVYSLADTGFIDSSSKHEHGHNNHYSYATTFIPWARFGYIDWDQYWTPKYILGLYRGYCHMHHFTANYTDNFKQFKNGKIFNSIYPNSFPASGASQINPTLVLTSNKVDEHGNTRELNKVKPIKEIDFVFCRTNNPKADVFEKSLSNTSGSGVTWELVKNPIGAGEWVVTDNWNTTKEFTFYKPYSKTLTDMMFHNDTGKKNKNRHRYRGDFTPQSDRGYRLDTEIGHTLFNDSSKRISYSNGDMVNYFTRVKSPAKASTAGGSVTIYKRKGDTMSVNETLFDATDFPFLNNSSDGQFEMTNADAKTITYEVRDLDRYDIYIRFRR